MIEIKTAFTDSDYLFDVRFSHGFHGRSIDERTIYSSQYVKNCSDSVLRLNYNKEYLNLNVDDSEIECHEVIDFLSGLNIRSALVDITSLDIPELALLLKALLKISGIDILLLYVEPEDYTYTKDGALDFEEYQLSDEILGFEGAGIPTISYPIDYDSPRKFIFFAGFEGARILSAIETYDITDEQVKIIFGIPAFKPGWELRSIRKNLQFLNEHIIHNNIDYCSANSIKQAIDILKDSNSLDENGLDYVIPIGTKPSSVGALLYFLCNMDKTRILYDQPYKKKDRTSGVGVKHFYKIMVL